MSQSMNQSLSQISVRELFIKIHMIWKFLLGQKKKVFLISIIGSFLGLGYAFLIPIRYVSKVTFVVEEGKTGGGSIAALAGQFGVDLGGAMGGGVFSGDNILLFLRSETLCRETLMTAYDSAGTESLADKYADMKKWKKKWKNNTKIGGITFSKFSTKYLPRKEDSLLQLVTQDILKNGSLLISKIDKKSSFIEVQSVMLDEKLSDLFSRRLVSIATERYVQSKIKVKSANLQILQRRVDSLAGLLNDKTYDAASSQQILVDVNPAMKIAPIRAEISSREKTMIATIFSEVVKNLEISKTIITQETPVIQMVDISSLPLNKVKTGKLTSMIMGGLISAIGTILYLLLHRWIIGQMSI
jgi:hypothetical protein